MNVTITKPNLMMNMINLAIGNAQATISVMETTRNILMSSVRRCCNCGKPLPDGEYKCQWCGWDNGIHNE